MTAAVADREAVLPNGSLLLVLPLSVYSREGRFYIDSQAANGLQQWLRHFSRLTLGLRLQEGVEPPADTVAIDSLGLGDRLTLEVFPWVWAPMAHFRAWAAVRRQLDKLIDSHDYLQFAIGGAWGDWSALGAIMAAKRGRKASVWTDRVESEVMRIEASRTSAAKRPFKWLNAFLARVLERRAIRCSALGLFHGMDTYRAYSKMGPNPHLVHDIHLKPADRIPDERLAAKVAGAHDGPLKFIYVGRLHPDKGVMDWIETLRLAAELGVDYRASWLGAGPQLEEARAQVAKLGLADRISLPGPEFDRARLLEALRDAHAMLFCHLTPESPRCLIEALVSGTPIIGYRSAYPEDLISQFGGGLLTPHQPALLSAELFRLSQDRPALVKLIEGAAWDGHDMNDEAVFAHRADLMKRFS
ncbi:MAG: glycosyltransferase [Sphingobium sp.]|nr:glycosyltransferase [Sphingobium sp.]